MIWGAVGRAQLALKRKSKVKDNGEREATSRFIYESISLTPLETSTLPRGEEQEKFKKLKSLKIASIFFG